MEKKYINTLWSRWQMEEVKLQVKAGTTIYASTGRNGKKQPDRMSTELFYLAKEGCYLELLDKNYLFNVATYTLDFDEKYLYTYAYEPEESWTTYTGDLNGDTYQQHKYVFKDQRYFRVCLKRMDGEAFAVEEEESIGNILRYMSFEAEVTKPASFFLAEIEDTVKKIQKLQDQGTMVVALLTDTHYTVNGTWQDTAANLFAVHQGALFDEVIHLGDLTDGLLSKEVLTTYTEKIRNDLEKLEIPVRIVLGNHDANYFGGNKEILSLSEQAALYLKTEEKQTYYHVDHEKQKIRSIFLSSYDNEETPRYGFDLGQIAWVKRILKATPPGYHILIFCHDAPLAHLDYWSDEIRNDDFLMEVLENHQKEYKNILAYIHGHTHADFIYRERLFPIISVGCAKCEGMQEKKPEGVKTEMRMLGTVSQDLWDVLLVKPKEKKLHFIRFGAGEDRIVKMDRKEKL